MMNGAGKQVDITPLFKAAGIDTQPVSIIETPGMYPYKDTIVDNWAYYTAVGMKRLKAVLEAEQKEVAEVAIVGIGSGVEGIAAITIFQPELKRLIVSDVDSEILDGTVVNIQDCIQDTNLQLVPVVGSFCEPIEQAGYKVDLVHGNVPNLPSTGEEDLSQGAEKGTFLPSSLYEGYSPPEKFVGWAMGAQYAYLMSARNILKPGGSVITELGGRMPLQLVDELFVACGYEHMEEVIVGFKEQTEALIDFLGYHRMEKAYGVSFEFYIYKEAKKLLEQRGFHNPTHNVSGREIKELLNPYKVSAGEAVGLYKKNVAVGHTVHLFRGHNA
jgi:hypothetical protein